MALLTVASTARTGVAVALAAAAAGGDEFVNDGRTWLHVKNGGASPRTVTIVTPQTVLNLAVADQVVSIPATDERLIGPFPAQTYNGTNGRASITYDAVTSLTVGAFKLGS